MIFLRNVLTKFTFPFDVAPDDRNLLSYFTIIIGTSKHSSLNNKKEYLIEDDIVLGIWAKYLSKFQTCSEIKDRNLKSSLSIITNKILCGGSCMETRSWWLCLSNSPHAPHTQAIDYHLIKTIKCVC